MTDLQLFSMPLCPFAHCVHLVLTEKALPFELTEIDLGNKPREFLKISPHGKVPALRHGANHICESSIINEYLEEVFPEPALFPREAAERARVRFWIDFANSRLYAPTASLLYGPHRENRTPALEQISAALRAIDANALAQKATNGPFWVGARLGIVDLTFYPWFEQLAALEHLRGVRMPPGLSRLKEWQSAIASQPCVRTCAKSTEFYLEAYPHHEPTPHA